MFKAQNSLSEALNKCSRHEIHSGEILNKCKKAFCLEKKTDLKYLLYYDFFERSALCLKIGKNRLKPSRLIL